MKRRILTDEQIEFFITTGYLAVEDSFDPKRYWHWVEDAVASVEVELDEPSTWTPYFQCEKEPGIVQPQAGYKLECKEMAPKAWDVLCDLLGEERIVQPYNWHSTFMINLDRYPDSDWVAPGPDSRGWHLDGYGPTKTRFLDASSPAILPIMYWRDVGHRGGGTYICPDSLKYVSKRLSKHPEGLNGYGQLPDGTTWRAHLPECTHFVELTGKAGTVIFVHGMVLHAASSNKLGVPRIMSRHYANLKEPPNFNRSRLEDFSPYELSILHALGVSRLDFRRKEAASDNAYR